MKRLTSSGYQTNNYSIPAQYLPDQNSVKAVLAMAHGEHKYRNLIIVARSGWLHHHDLPIPSLGSHPNLCVTITNGEVTRKSYSSSLKHIINRQGYFIQILNGPVASHKLTTCSSGSQGIVCVAQFLRNLPFRAGQNQGNLLKEAAGLSEETSLEFTTWADDSCKISEQRPDDSSVLQALVRAHEYQCSGNLIVIVRNRWLKFNGLSTPNDLNYPNLCVTITNGILNRAFYSEDLSHIIKKQSYFIQLFN